MISMSSMAGRLLVLFVFTATLAGAQVRKGAWTPATETMERGYSSVSYWTYRDDGVEVGGGRISIEHGLPRWPAELDDPGAFDRATRGKFWRLGNNKWTTLDTNLPLRFEGRRVQPGIYYLATQRDPSGNWSLVFVKPEAVRAGLLDAWDFVPRPSEVPVAFSVPLAYSRAAEKAATLRMALALEDGDMSAARLRIQWGVHLLETTMKIEMVSPDFYKTAGGKR